MRGRLSSQRGTALLETALVLPIVLLVSVSIFEFGRAYQTWQILTNAAREGARIAVLPGTTDADVNTRVLQYITSGSLPNVTSTVVTIDRSTTIAIGTGTAPSTRITVAYPFSFMVLNPVAKLVVPNSTLGGAFTMSSRAEMRNE